MSRFSRWLFSIALVLAPATALANGAYEIIDLGHLGGSSTIATAINDVGQATGGSANANGDTRTFLWEEPGGIREVNDATLPVAAGASSLGNDINDAGLIVGFAEVEGNDPRATSWDTASSDARTNLGALRIGVLGSAEGVNDAGLIVGWTEIGLGPDVPRAFRWQSGTLTEIQLLQGGVSVEEDPVHDPAGARAYDVNAAGVVVGEIILDGRLFGASWDAADEVFAVNADLVQEALASDEVNSLRVVDPGGVGFGFGRQDGVSVDFQAISFDRSDGVLGDLSPATSFLDGLLAPIAIQDSALGVNASGVIVGASTLANQVPHAVRWVGGAVEDLNLLTDINGTTFEDLGWLLLAANDVNDQGWMVGLGINPEGDLAGWLIRPAAANEPPDCAGAVASPFELLPPDGGFRDVSIGGVEDPEQQEVAIVITSIFQDEPVEAARRRRSGRASAETCPDATGVGTDTAQLRAERSSRGGGRVYHLRFRADDPAGGTCEGEVTVCVPIDGIKRRTCRDDGPRYDSTGPCSPP